MSIFLVSLLFVLGLLTPATATTYTQSGFTLQVIDKSNGQLSSSTIQAEVNLFFQLYPSLASQYVDAPTNVTMTFDPSVAQNTVAISGIGLSLSSSEVAANPGDSSYMNYGLSSMLSYFYSTIAPTTTIANPTTTSTTP